MQYPTVDISSSYARIRVWFSEYLNMTIYTNGTTESVPVIRYMVRIYNLRANPDFDRFVNNLIRLKVIKSKEEIL
jgi:hypothetical protein